MLGHQIKNNLTDDPKPNSNVKITDQKGAAGAKKGSCDC